MGSNSCSSRQYKSQTLNVCISRTEAATNSKQSASGSLLTALSYRVTTQKSRFCSKWALFSNPITYSQIIVTYSKMITSTGSNNQFHCCSMMYYCASISWVYHLRTCSNTHTLTLHANFGWFKYSWYKIFHEHSKISPHGNFPLYPAPIYFSLMKSSRYQIITLQQIANRIIRTLLKMGRYYNITLCY